MATRVIARIVSKQDGSPLQSASILAETDGRQFLTIYRDPQATEIEMNPVLSGPEGEVRFYLAQDSGVFCLRYFEDMIFFEANGGTVEI